MHVDGRKCKQIEWNRKKNIGECTEIKRNERNDKKMHEI